MTRDIYNTTIHTWFERDRAHVELRDVSEETIVEWWDDDVFQAIEDGFLSDSGFVLGKLMCENALHTSAVEYANRCGL